MNKELLNKYASLKIEIKKLEAEADELNPQILTFLQEQEVDEIDLDGVGKITKASRRKYTYSSEVQEMEAGLKEKKKVEEQTGSAEYTENPYVLFKAN